MIKYGDLVQYIKDNHVNWNTDLFDVLRGFFNQYSPPLSSPPSNSPIQQRTVSTHKDTEYFMSHATGEFKEPEGGEYTSSDLIDLFSR